MRIVLVDPPCFLRLWEPHSEHLGLGYLAAGLRSGGYDVEILDASLMRWSVRKTVKEILRREADIVGFSVVQPALRNTLRLVGALRKTGFKAHICAGGHFSTLKPVNLLEMCSGLDSVVRGEGDITFLDLATKICSGEDWRTTLGMAYRDGDEIVVTAPRPLVTDLDTLPFPARDTLPLVLRWGRRPMVISSKGCEWNCTFCGPRAFYAVCPGKKWRGRSAENFVDEMESLCTKWGVRNIDILDDNFFPKGEEGIERAYKIGEEVLRRGLRVRFSIECRVDNVGEELFAFLKTAGLTEVRLGVESGVQRLLDRYRKGVTVEENKRAILLLKRLGIPCKIGFISFDPTMTLDEFIENGQFLREVGYPRAFNQSDLGVIAGTPLERQLARENRLVRGPFSICSYGFDSRTVRFLHRMFIIFQNVQTLLWKWIDRASIMLRELKYRCLRVSPRLLPSHQR